MKSEDHPWRERQFRLSIEVPYSTLAWACIVLRMMCNGAMPDRRSYRLPVKISSTETAVVVQNSEPGISANLEPANYERLPMSDEKMPTRSHVIGDFFIHCGMLITLYLVALATCLIVVSWDVPILTRLTCYLFAVAAASTFWKRTYLRLNLVGVLILSLVFVLFAELAWVPRYIGIPEIQRNQPAD